MRWEGLWRALERRGMHKNFVRKKTIRKTYEEIDNIKISL
jgi:hypothetical protein